VDGDTVWCFEIARLKVEYIYLCFLLGGVILCLHRMKIMTAFGLTVGPFLMIHVDIQIISLPTFDAVVVSASREKGSEAPNPRCSVEISRLLGSNCSLSENHVYDVCFCVTRRRR
jgi:hypothetical protein